MGKRNYLVFKLNCRCMCPLKGINMAFSCPNCSAKVFSHTALCDDKNDPNKEFGCPNCGQFYVLKIPYRDRWKETAINLTALALGYAASSLIDIGSLELLIFLLVGTIAFLLSNTHWSGRARLKKSPYKSPIFEYRAPYTT